MCVCVCVIFLGVRLCLFPDIFGTFHCLNFEGGKSLLTIFLPCLDLSLSRAHIRPSKYGWTPTHFASFRGSTDTLRVLLPEKGVDLALKGSPIHLGPGFFHVPLCVLFFSFLKLIAGISRGDCRLGGLDCIKLGMCQPACGFG